VYAECKLIINPREAPGQRGGSPALGQFQLVNASRRGRLAATAPTADQAEMYEEEEGEEKETDERTEF
jgi:hypothetical protein